MISEAEIKFYKKIIPSCSVIFDVGCRDDDMFERINPLAEVHYFDPNISRILCNKENYNNYALGSYNHDDASFYYKYGSFMHRTEEQKFKEIHQSKKTQIRRLDGYCDEKGISKIDFLKIDTEGWDFEVLIGAGDMLNNVKYIQFEFFHEYANGKHLADICEFLKPRFIYEIGGKPMNYLATNENINYLIRVR